MASTRSRGARLGLTSIGILLGVLLLGLLIPGLDRSPVPPWTAGQKPDWTGPLRMQVYAQPIPFESLKEKATQWAEQNGLAARKSSLANVPCIDLATPNGSITRICAGSCHLSPMDGGSISSSCTEEKGRSTTICYPPNSWVNHIRMWLRMY